jgi:hypothetical protein
MRELLVRGKNTTDPEDIDPGGRSVEDSPVKSDFTFYLSSVVIGRFRPLFVLNIFFLPNFKIKLNTVACFPFCVLNLILLTCRIRRALNNASKWQMGFNSAFKWLKKPWQEENCAFLCSYAASSGNVLPKFR